MKRILLTLSGVLLISFFTSAQNPGVTFSPTYLSSTVMPGNDTTVHTHLYNSTAEEVNFSFPAFIDMGNRGSGGPDAFGYRWTDSDENNLNYSWIEISETGTEVTGLIDDNVAGPFDIGFDFPFYSQNRNHFWINSNGVIQFTNTLIGFANQPIPSNVENTRDFIAGLWDDLNMTNPESRVFYQVFGEQTVIQFQKAHHYGAGFVTFQVVIRINGTILINIKQVSEDFTRNSCTIGIQSPEASVGLQVAFNQEYIRSELTIQIKLSNITGDFVVSVDPPAGTIAPQSFAAITLTYSAVGYEPANFQETVICNTNSPGFETLPVYNLMIVTGNPKIAGVIRDAQTNTGLPGVAVTAGSFSTITGENGHYDLVVDPGTYVMTFSKEGYNTETRDGITVAPDQVREVSLALTHSTSFILGGTTFAGVYQLDMGYVNAFKTIDDQVVDIFADLIDTLGYYKFISISTGNYRVKAEPAFGSEFEGEYLPTYYGDVVHWADAQVINLTQNVFNADIHLVAATLNNSNGPGKISGYIYHSGETKSGNSAVPAPEIPIFLKQENNYAMAISNNEGYFEFKKLEYGTYAMFAELFGKNSEFRNITLSHSNVNSETNDLFIYAADILYSIGENLPQGVKSVGSPYPNPALNQATISLNLLQPLTMRFEIFDALGQSVSVSDHSLGMGNHEVVIPLSQLRNGIYWLQIRDESGAGITRKLVKN